MGIAMEDLLVFVILFGSFILTGILLTILNLVFKTKMFFDIYERWWVFYLWLAIVTAMSLYFGNLFGIG